MNLFIAYQYSTLENVCQVPTVNRGHVQSFPQVHKIMKKVFKKS
nr:MAG TPA: hypothetical protein [Caudoviricetes sp.]